MMKKNKIPNDEKSIFYTRVDALRPNAPPLGVAPAADNNIMKVTKDCLFIRPAFGTIYGGRRSMSWWATIALVFLLVFLSALEYIGYLHDTKYNNYSAGALAHYIENWDFPLGTLAFFIVGFSWIFIPWRTQLPIIFNRKTLKVSCIIEGQYVNQSWDQLEAYIKDITTFAVGGVPTNDGVLTLSFPYAGPGYPNNNSRLRIGISGTQDADEAFFNRGIYGAAMLWEYIRLYMCEGKDALPHSSALNSYRATSIQECITSWNPFRMFLSRTWWKRLLAPLLFPIAAPILWLITLGDLIYMGLDRILPCKKWPQELIDACDGAWNGEE